MRCLLSAGGWEEVPELGGRHPGGGNGRETRARGEPSPLQDRHPAGHPVAALQLRAGHPRQVSVRLCSGHRPVAPQTPARVPLPVPETFSTVRSEKAWGVSTVCPHIMGAGWEASLPGASPFGARATVNVGQAEADGLPSYKWEACPGPVPPS